MKSVWSILAVVTFAGAGGTAAAQPDIALTAEAVADAFEAHGVSSTIGTDDYGDPYVELEAGGALPSDFANVIFFECAPSGDCGSILMVASFRPQRRPVYLDAINQWNVERRWVRAYIDSENYVVLDMDVSSYGGITDQALETQVGRFVENVGAFTQFIRR